MTPDKKASDSELLVRMMNTLLDIEWSQATDAFKAAPNFENWDRLDVAMTAIRQWDQMNPEYAVAFVNKLKDGPILSWIEALCENVPPRDRANRDTLHGRPI